MLLEIVAELPHVGAAVQHGQRPLPVHFVHLPIAQVLCAVGPHPLTHTVPFLIGEWKLESRDCVYLRVTVLAFVVSSIGIAVSTFAVNATVQKGALVLLPPRISY